MKRKIIVCDTDKCNGCRICEYACAAELDSSLNVRHARIRVLRLEPIFNVAISCIACEEPECVKGCPNQAIVFDKKERRIKVDKDKCDGCGLCIERCRYGCISLELSGKSAYVCDYCEDSPRCVEYCPKGALSYKKENQGSFQARVREIK